MIQQYSTIAAVAKSAFSKQVFLKEACSWCAVYEALLIIGSPFAFEKWKGIEIDLASAAMSRNNLAGPAGVSVRDESKGAALDMHLRFCPGVLNTVRRLLIKLVGGTGFEPVAPGV